MKTIKNAEFENTNCIICGADETDLIYKGKGENGFKVNECICKQCGFVYLNPRWSEDTYFKFYQTIYDKYWRKYLANVPPERDGASYYLPYQRLIKYFPDFKPTYVLDIGSGNGKKLSYIIERFPEAQYFAIEPSIVYKTEIENRGIRFISNDVNSDWDKNVENKFDLIIMRHTLEHFLDPIRVLAKVKNSISDNGLLYIGVPDAQCEKNRLIDHNFTIVHPYIFSENSISNLLQKCGFEVVEIGNGNKSANKDLFVFAKTVKNGTNKMSYDEEYQKTKNIFLQILNKELSFAMKCKRFVKVVVNYIIRFKKIFFPKPVSQKQYPLLKED